MKILMVHNKYRQPGGEDQVYVSETALLEAHGHQVLRYEMHNDQTVGMNPLVLAKKTIWNTAAYQELRDLIRKERPLLAHFHNTFPLISPAGYYAAKSEGVPVVQTLHNYRLYCLNAQFMRDGGVCEDCKGKTVPWPGVLHKCYRGSRTASAVTAAMLTTHRAMHTYTDMVDVYVALTDFARSKFVECGLPAEKVVVKPNFKRTDPGPGEGLGGYALYVGRLSPEKGITTLIEAWEQLGNRIPLKIAGDGPLAPEVAEATGRCEGVEWLGHQERDQVLALMNDAFVLIFPSVWYEGFGMVLVESYAAGTPMIVSRLGSMRSLVQHGRTGLQFKPGDPKDLVAQVDRLLSHPEEVERMRAAVRREFKLRFAAQRNYRLLMEIYYAAGVRNGA